MYVCIYIWVSYNVCKFWGHVTDHELFIGYYHHQCTQGNTISVMNLYCDSILLVYCEYVYLTLYGRYCIIVVLTLLYGHNMLCMCLLVFGGWLDVVCVVVSCPIIACAVFILLALPLF